MVSEEKKDRTALKRPISNAYWGIVDLLLMMAGFVIAQAVQTGTFLFDQPLQSDDRVCMLVCCALGMFFFWGFGMYSIVLLKPWPTLVTVALSALYSFICSFMVVSLLTGGLVDVALLAAGIGWSYPLLLIWRIALYYYHMKKRHRQKMLIIEKKKDDNSRIRRMKYACMSQFDAWYEQVDVENIESVKTFIAERFPSYDVICLMETVPFEVRNLFMDAGAKMNKDFYVVPLMYEMNFSKVSLAVLDDVMVFHLSSSHITPTSMVIKRAMDIVLSFVALVVAAIPMAIIAVAVKVSSPGPVFYKQLRLTKDKKEFYIYKFRSMVQNAEKLSGPTLAVKDDPRVTKVGRVLRKMRLDELPQILNILKGDMSIVGPRPERPFFVEQYEKEIPNYDRRFEVRAGLTALSHVYGRYSTEVADRTRYDLLYIQKYSLLLDIRIMLLTSRTIFLSDAAEGIWTVDRREAAQKSTRG